MKRLALIGPPRGGKSTLINYLEQETSGIQKTVVPEYHKDCLDTPGEYFEHRIYYGRFQALVDNYDVVGLVVPCLMDNVYIPPNFMSMFPNKEHIGIISKVDIGSKDHIEKCKLFLQDTGIEFFFEISVYQKLGLENLKQYLNNR